MIYLDTNILIYAIENNPKYGESCKKILLDIESGEIKACASILVLVETLNVLTKINRTLKDNNKKELDIKKNIDAVISLPIVWLELNLFVVKRAAEYDYSITGIDYIHIASMELNSVTKIISLDNELDKVDFIKVIDPLKDI